MSKVVVHWQFMMSPPKSLSQLCALRGLTVKNCNRLLGTVSSCNGHSRCCSGVASLTGKALSLRDFALICRMTINSGSKQFNEKSRSSAFQVSLGGTDEHFSLSESFEKSSEWMSNLLGSMLVYPNFISTQEEANILKEIEPYISRLHYESSHWDDAIHNYRETERAKWNQKNTEVINRVRTLCFPPGVPQLKYVHILDLEKTGVIKPHIDSVRFCGNTIAGLSLLSGSIMRLRHDVQKNFYCDVYLPRLSLYVMRDFVRYEFTHEILGEKDSIFKNRVIPRDRRISIICRNEPETTTDEPVFQPINS